MEINGSLIINNGTSDGNSQPNGVLPLSFFLNNFPFPKPIFVKTKPEGLPFSEEAFRLIDVVLRVSITGSLALFGMVTNIINAVLFYRQGILSDGSNVSLFGLSISESFSCFFNVLSNIFIGIMLWEPSYTSWSWDVNDFYFAIAIRPRTIFTQITCWITAFIAIERFISVVFPFKVKQIVTPPRSCFVVASMFVLTTALYYPQYVRMKLAKVPIWSGLQLRYVNTRTITKEHFNAFLYIHPVALRFLSVAIVLVCNMVIMWKVVIASKFRKTSAGTSGGQNKKGNSETSNSDTKGEKNPDADAKMKRDNKDQRLLRMMVIICVVFLICATPDLILVSALYIAKVEYHNFIRETAYAVSYLFEICSSAVNIFIFYFMSTRYRKEFNKCCICLAGKKKSRSSTTSATSGVSASSTQVVTTLTTKQQ